MSVSAPPTPHISVEDRLSRLERIQMTQGVPIPAPANPTQVKALLWQSILHIGTFLAMLSFAYWLGVLNTTVSTASQKVDKLNDAVVSTSKDSISSRLSVIETKLDALNNKPQR